MPRPSMTGPQVEEKKKLIIDTALEILSQDGYGGLSMRKIAVKVGMTATNIYHYFSNKDELNIEMRRYGYIMLYERLLTVYEETKSVDERLRRMIWEFIAFSRDHAAYYNHMFTMTTPKREDYIGTKMESLADRELESSIRVLHIFRKLLLEYRAEGGIMLLDDTMSVVIILNYIHGLISLYNAHMLIYFFENPDLEADRMVNLVIELILGLKGNSEADRYIKELGEKI